MHRLTKLFALAAVVLAFGTLAPAAVTAGRQPVAEVGGELPAVLGDVAACPPAHTGLYLPSADAVACVHDAVDGLPGKFDALAAASAGVKAVEPTCYGDGVSGNRVHLLYAYIEGQPNRIAEFDPVIRQMYLPRIEGVFRTTSAAQGREIGVRFHAPGCVVAIDVIQVPAAAAAEKDGFARTSAVMDAVVAAGFDAPNRKYHVWADMASEGPLCGVATTYAISATGLLGLPLALKEPYGLTDNPTPINPNNANLGGPLSSIAVSFRGVATGPGGTVIGQCWGGGSTGARTETHELLHTLGAVQTSSPNSNGFGHCFDGPDIMCYTEGGVKVINACTNSKGVDQLDCNSDDYFAMSPPLGSYLSTHWNIANSTFLGPQPVDQVPVPTALPAP